jgi:type IV secretion system protein VirB3
VAKKMNGQQEVTIESHPIFGALTRPAMTAGVTFEYHGINLIVSVCAFIALGNVLYGLIFVPLHAFGWLSCRNDPAFFSLLYKRISFLPAMPNKKIWGVRAYEPC